MNGFKILIVLTGLLASQLTQALSPEAEQGKASAAVCLSCHNAELTPPKAPPFFGVQNKYKLSYPDKKEFVNAVTNWVKNPTEVNALMKRPVKMLGIMPALPLPDDMLNQIAAYLYEEQFEPPCVHWANDLATAGAPGKNGRNGNHTKMVQNQYNKFCSKQ